jgi:peptide/nickel transport system permease protein
MTELDAATFVPPPDGPPAGDRTDAAEPVPVSFSRRTLQLTFARLGARAGLAWILFMAVVAAFAPLIAGTHPILLNRGGQWSSPLLQYLTPADVVLQVAFWAAVVLWFLHRIRVGVRAAILTAVIVVTAVLAIVLVHPPEPVVYDQYRAASLLGEVTVAYYPPVRFSPNDHLMDQPSMQGRPHAPDVMHPMGTTSGAADLAANMIYASRIALSIGFVATGVAVVLGVIMGAAMGYFGGWVDLIGMRIVEVFESIPTLLLLLAFAGMFQNAGPAALYIMMAIIGFLSSFGYAEFVRAEFLSLRDRDFVHAARASGLPVWSILFRHLLPNGLTPVIINVSFGIAGAILAESTLSFLNIGLKDEASWGNLLNQALGSGGSFYWWLAIYPGAAIFLTVFSYNLIGESLRDALDPRLVHKQ